MSARTTNARRRAVERAVKQSQIKRARIDAELGARQLAGESVKLDTFVVHDTNIVGGLTAKIGEPIDLS